jgi:hypothetical protein
MSATTDTTDGAARGGVPLPVTVLAWLWVAVPFGYGLYRLVERIPALFG